MRINKAAVAYGLVTFNISLSCGVLGKFIPEPFCYVAVIAVAGLGALIATASIDLMSEIKNG